MNKNIENYYNRFKPEYKELLLRDGYGTQASEHNEMQSIFDYRLTNIANGFFKDGDILEDAQIAVNANTGAIQANSGKIYIIGHVWNLESKEFSIPLEGSVAVGVRISSRIISELEDPNLRNPAQASRGVGLPGAWRKEMIANWDFAIDGEGDDFYPIYEIEDGILSSKEAPPNLDVFNSVLAKYDRDSTGTGTYTVEGFFLTQAEDLEDGRQVYNLSEGRGRISGMGVELSTSRRIVYEAIPDTRFIDTEVHTANSHSTTENGQKIEVFNAPIGIIEGIRITEEKTVSLIHGAYTGASDILPDTSIVSIQSVRQGETVFEANVDYQKTGDSVDWSLAGNEPLSGSTFEVTYRYIKNIEPENLDDDGFIVKNAVNGTQILISYTQKIPRYDSLVMNQDGQVNWFKGVANTVNPKKANVPDSVLSIATVYQNWRRGKREITNDSVRVVQFDEIASMNEKIDYVLQEVARQRLEADVSTREAGAKVGLFVDPLLNDDMRDQGIEQTAAVIDGGILTLPIRNVQVKQMLADVQSPTTRAYSYKTLLNQPLRTDEMKVNPYMAFDPLPARVTINPQVDRWTEVESDWTSDITRYFGKGSKVRSASSAVELVSSSTNKIENLRQIEVQFTLNDFGNGEILDSVTFDGINVEVRE